MRTDSLYGVPSRSQTTTGLVEMQVQTFLAPIATASSTASSGASHPPEAYGPATSASSPYLSIATGLVTSAKDVPSHNGLSADSAVGVFPTPVSNFDLSFTPALAFNLDESRKDQPSYTTSHGNRILSIATETSGSRSTITTKENLRRAAQRPPPNALTILESATMTDASRATTTNALSILLDAAPSDVAQSVESVLSSISTALATPSASPSNTPLVPISLTSQPAGPTSFSTSATLPSSVTPISSLPTKVSTPTPSTMMTVASQPSTSSSSTPAPTAASTSHGSGTLKNASVVGIATGLVAGAVLVFLIGIFLWRRRSQGKAPFANRRPSQRSSRRGSKRVFPEEAFLYDPKMTPRAGSPPLAAGGHSRDESATSLIPDPREGTVELSSAPPSPPQQASSPLLSPVAAADGRRSHSGSPSRERRNSGGGSPSGRRSRSSLAVSRTDPTRPMSAIWEEPPRPSMDARTGLLSPGQVNMARHST